MSKRISYARGFPYGAPLAMIRGGATKDAAVKDFIKEQGFRWNGRSYAWESYLYAKEFGMLLIVLRDSYGCEIVPKAGMDESYIIDLDRPEFQEPE